MSKSFLCVILLIFAAFTFPCVVLADTIPAASGNSVVIALTPSSLVVQGSVTSVLIMNPGGRIFFGALALDRSSVLPDIQGDAPGGAIILTAHPFGQLRRLLNRAATPAVVAAPQPSTATAQPLGSVVVVVLTVAGSESESGSAVGSSGTGSLGVGSSATTSSATGSSATGSTNQGGPGITALQQEVTTVPEPSSLILLLGGVAALCGYARARGKRP